MSNWITVTKDDIKAMKQAETVVYRMNVDTIQIELSKPVSKKLTNDLYGFDKMFGDMYYQFGKKNEYPQNVSACVVSYTNSLQGIAELLREGDKLFLEFSKDGGRSDVIEENGLVSDYLFLIVQQERRGKIKMFRFLIDRYVGYDNSARMIKTI